MPHTPLPTATPNFRTLDLNLLRVFDEVMSERSLTRAARNLSLTQPAVSNALRRLREALGDELVHRSGQGVEPTAYALALWPAVHNALRELQELIVPSSFVPATADDTFVLAMADATAAALIPGLVDIIETEAPGVSIRVVPLATRDPRRLLDDAAADLAIGYFPAVLADLTARSQTGAPVSFAHQRLYDGEYVCVMRQGHPFASGPLTVNQFFTAGRVVANSNLLTVLPRHFVNVTGIADELVYRELPFDVPTVHVDAVWHHRQQQHSAHQWLRQTIARSAAQAFAEKET